MSWRKRIKASPIYPVVRLLRAPYHWYRRRRAEARRLRRNRRIYREAVRGTDLFLVGHPKSGNTWLAYMLAVLLEDDRKGRLNTSNLGDVVPVIHGADKRIADYGDLPDPRVFRGEHPDYPEALLRVVYICRDPRAVLLSYWHMYRAIRADDETSLRAFVDEYLREGNIARLEPELVRWDRQVGYWAGRADREPERVMIVRYRDMKEDRRAVVERVARFADLPTEADRLDLAAERGGFRAMRSSEERHGAEAFLEAGVEDERRRFYRKGKVDAWRAEMPADVAARIVREFGATMEAVGLPVDPGRVGSATSGSDDGAGDAGDPDGAVPSAEAPGR